MSHSSVSAHHSPPTHSVTISVLRRLLIFALLMLCASSAAVRHVVRSSFFRRRCRRRRPAPKIRLFGTARSRHRETGRCCDVIHRTPSPFVGLELRGGGGGGGGGDLSAETDREDHDDRGDTTKVRSGRAKSAISSIGGVSSSVASSSSSSYKISTWSIKGRREYMEDEYFISTGPLPFAAVFDGHGGAAVSKYLRQNLYANLQAALPVMPGPIQIPGLSPNEDVESSSESSQGCIRKHAPSVEDCEEALRSSFNKIDGEVQRISHWSFQGSTAVAVLVHEQPGGIRTIISANVGDSRAVLSREREALELTKDHKPNDAVEKMRIEALGGEVKWHGLVDERGKPIHNGGVYRINGNLALSRAIGDRSERPLVSSEVDIRSEIVQEADEFVVVASDGVWDVMTSQELVSFVHSVIDAPEKRGTLPGKIDKSLYEERQSCIARLITEEALQRGSTDNMSCVVVWLPNAP